MSSQKIVWSAIVRNEAAILKRCIDSLMPHIDGAVLVDTGSTDGTPELIQQLFDAAGKPVEISSAPFVNFEQARNEALRCARISRMEWDWLLLCDADMTLRVKQEPLLNGEQGFAYDMKQVAGSLSYHNRPLLSRHADCWYRGVTHEYCDIPSAGVIDRAEFIDHADGANRSGKLQRDIALLEEALKTETRPGLIQRYHFYLGGSYYDLGNYAAAAEHYRIRAALGGFDEEVWYASMRRALCHKHMADQAGFLWEMLGAYQLRPHRAEVLHELAKFFRERGDNSASLLFAVPGMQLPYPAADQLFVDDRVCGLKEEFAICAYYDESRRAQGAAVCNELALAGSQQARSNQYWYLEPLVNHVPSFRATRIELPLPIGWVASNPSVINDAGQPLAVVRSVNYVITPEGMYSVLGADGGRNNGNPIRTRNHLVRFSGDLTVEDSRELTMPSNWPEPEFWVVRGFEDSRLFKWGDELWTLSCVRELSPEGWCEQVLAPVDIGGYGDRWSVVRPAERLHEKNWLPWAVGGDLLFVYRLGTIIDTAGKEVFHQPPDFDVSRISGGSQVIELDEHTWIALVHEARTIPGRPQQRYYQHRFVSFRPNGRVDRLSLPFCFHDRQVEFAAGLALFGKRLIASYGVMDREAWLAEIDVDEVVRFIYRDSRDG